MKCDDSANGAVSKNSLSWGCDMAKVWSKLIFESAGFKLGNHARRHGSLVSVVVREGRGFASEASKQLMIGKGPVIALQFCLMNIMDVI